MIRTRRDGDTGHIGRLAVVPDLRGAGIGRWLPRQAEATVDKACGRAVLSTGSRSERNIGLYLSEGADGTVHLSKPLPAGSQALSR
ncbi:GNAT family N-acetyltransferase [Streptosporangium sp. CA-115845]|uniref:GNAT family N-acetyltransferase n=1 Tax=Streptosporangium sp. CA-115845 TaxID=3240071 RepID=UPI003D8F37EB